MASNSTTTVLGHAASLTTAQYVGLTAAVLLISVLYKFSSPPMDPREPPLAKPGIPIIGHIIGLARHGIDYFELLRPSPSSPSTPSAITLPILSGKAYILYDIPLVQSALRHKNLTFDLLSLEFAQRVFGLSDLAMEKLWGPDHEIESSVAPLTMQRIKAAMQGQNLLRMNVKALGYVAGVLNGIGKEGEEGGLRVGNLYLWLRDFMTMATAEGIYGGDNPVREDPSLIDALW